MGFILCLLYIIHVFREFTRPKDYTIRKILLEYNINDSNIKPTNKFWETQKSQVWHELPDIYIVDVKNKVYLPIPDGIENCILKIVYVFNNKEYIYATVGSEYKWPPVKTNVNFVLPIKNAVLLNSNNRPVKNITAELNQFAGPRCDFHGIQVPLYEMIDKPFTKLRVTNIMNEQSVIDFSG